jgi:hypothetical protein
LTDAALAATIAGDHPHLAKGRDGGEVADQCHSFVPIPLGKKLTCVQVVRTRFADVKR